MMFKKGQFIQNIHNNAIFKVVKITHDLGNNRIYILRPKGRKVDFFDIEETTKYAHETYKPIKKNSININKLFGEIRWANI